MSTRTVIDADGLVLGRMASVVAKRLLAGETIDLVNAQNIVISGNKVKLVKEWKEFLKVGGFGKGPVHHRKAPRDRPPNRSRDAPLQDTEGRRSIQETTRPHRRPRGA